MVNKKNLWFLTLFSLILVLSVYYITMPDELLLTTSTKKVINNIPEIKIDESDILVSLRVDSDSVMEKEIEELQLVLTNADSTIEEKNIAYEKIKKLNTNRGEEEKIEKLITDKYNLKAFVKISENNINVTINSNDKGNSEANKIMRTIQEQYNIKKNITIKFQE